MIRPFITMLVEYLLTIIILRKGKYNKYILAAVLFFLATYQLGEVLTFITQGDRVGLQIAYFATTMLPPLGVLLMEKITKKKLGYPIFQFIGAIFAVTMLLDPSFVNDYELGPSCIHVFSYDVVTGNYWLFYYQSTLMYTMLVMLYYINDSANRYTKLLMQNLLLAYISFDLVALVLVKIVPFFRYSVASLMCALAVIAAFVFTRISLIIDEKKVSFAYNTIKIPTPDLSKIRIIKRFTKGRENKQKYH